MAVAGDLEVRIVAGGGGSELDVVTRRVQTRLRRIQTRLRRLQTISFFINHRKHDRLLSHVFFSPSSLDQLQKNQTLLTDGLKKQYKGAGENLWTRSMKLC